jgi:hypothetical protein
VKKQAENGVKYQKLALMLTEAVEALAERDPSLLTRKPEIVLKID